MKATPRIDWRTIAPLARPRANPIVVPLVDGRVLVARGTRGAELKRTMDKTVEIWDPVADRWQRANEAVSPDGQLVGVVALAFESIGRTWRQIDRLPPAMLESVQISRDRSVTRKSGDKNGDFLVLESKRGPGRRIALEERRFGFEITPLADGRLLVIGGYKKYTDFSWDVVRRSVGLVEIVEPKSAKSRPAGELGFARHQHAAALLPDGSVIVVGGRHGEAAETRKCELGRLV